MTTYLIRDLKGNELGRIEAKSALAAKQRWTKAQGGKITEGAMRDYWWFHKIEKAA